MKPGDVLTKLWHEKYFEQPHRTSEIEKIILDKYKVTASNLSVNLKRCKFLRKRKEGWIQKYPSTGSIKNFKLFNGLGIHKEIEKVSKQLYQDGHYSQAVFEACKKLSQLVKAKSGLKDFDGKNLMLRVFSVKNPTLHLNKLKTQSEKDEQEGYMHLYAGASQGIRNPKGHENKTENSVNAIEQIILVSHLAKKLDSMQVKPTNAPANSTIPWTQQ